MKAPHSHALPKPILARSGPAITIAIYAILMTFGQFSGGIWAIGGIALPLILASFAVQTNHKLPKPDFALTAIAILALGIMALSPLWSQRPDLSLHESMRMGTIFIPLLLLFSSEIQKQSFSNFLFPAIASSLVCGALALGIELKFDGPLQKFLHHGEVELTKYNRGLTYAILIAFPSAAWIASVGSKFPFASTNRSPCLKRKEIMLAIFILAIAFPANYTESRAGKLALAVGALVTVAAKLNPKIVTIFLSVLPALLTAWPLAARTLFASFHDKLNSIPASWQHRMEIWDYISWRIGEKIWLGWGLGTSHTLPFQEPNGSLYKFAIAPAMHPHNVISELWVELGLPGLAAGLLLAYCALRKASKLSSPIVPFALGGWAAALCLSLIAYNFWTDSLFAAFALTGFAFSLLDQRLQEKPALATRT